MHFLRLSILFSLVITSFVSAMPTRSRFKEARDAGVGISKTTCGDLELDKKFEEQMRASFAQKADQEKSEKDKDENNDHFRKEGEVPNKQEPVMRSRRWERLFKATIFTGDLELDKELESLKHVRNNLALYEEKLQTKVGTVTDSPQTFVEGVEEELPDVHVQGDDAVVVHGSSAENSSDESSSDDEGTFGSASSVRALDRGKLTPSRSSNQLKSDGSSMARSLNSSIGSSSDFADEDKAGQLEPLAKVEREVETEVKGIVVPQKSSVISEQEETTKEKISNFFSMLGEGISQRVGLVVGVGQLSLLTVLAAKACYRDDFEKNRTKSKKEKVQAVARKCYELSLGALKDPKNSYRLYPAFTIAFYSALVLDSALVVEFCYRQATRS